MTLFIRSTILLSFLFTSTYAQTIDTTSNKYYRQKSIAIIREVVAINFYTKIGWVNDKEKLFSIEEEKQLDSIITAFEKETTIEIAIVTIDSLHTSKEKFEDFTLRIANKWRVGKPDKANGVLIGLSVGHRAIRIQNGFGIEKLITNEETKTIISNYFTPYFKKEEYFNGMKNGLIALTELLRSKLN